MHSTLSFAGEHCVSVCFRSKPVHMFTHGFVKCRPLQEVHALLAACADVSCKTLLRAYSCDICFLLSSTADFT